MSSLGIYFGLKDICLVETRGRKILNSIRLPHPSLASAELEEKVPADVKLIALLKDALRTYRIKANEATFCISGQDMVIRTFEIPLLPANELRGAINFEAKKYIPFKIEDLDYDFQVSFNRKNKTSLVLFVGIKKEILENYLSISKQLNLKVDALEYSAFSLLRFLKLAGFSDTGVVASFCFDLNSEDETNFMVFENGFPLFSRDIVLAEGLQGFEQTAEDDFAQKLDKLKNEIRVSLDYYSRKFMDKDIKNIFVVSDAKSRKELDHFFKETTIPVKFVDTQKVLGRNVSYSSVLAKSFAAAQFKSSPLEIKINLVGAKLKAARVAAAGFRPFALLEDFKLDLKLIFLGIVVCAAVFGYGITRLQPLRQELAGIRSQRLKVSTVTANESYEMLSALNSKYSKRIASLDNLIKNHMYATYPLDVIPRALPNGVWLSNFSLKYNQDGALELALDGQVYLEDSDKEFESVNSFLTNLKNDPVFSRYFRKMTISSIDRKQVGNASVAVFNIVCSSSPEKK
jgi:Tfp pilus assembly PilM family ATPase